MAAFARSWKAAIAGWDAELAPFKGRKVFLQHRTLSYFLDWSGLVDAGELEPRPGVPPPPSHLAELVLLARKEGVKAIVAENYYDTKSAQVVAEHAGAKVVLIPGDVGGEPGLSTYLDYVGAVVKRVIGGLR